MTSPWNTTIKKAKKRRKNSCFIWCGFNYDE